MNSLIIFLILTKSLLTSATSCLIYPSLICSCYQSNNDLNFVLPMKSYSHLYCKGNLLTNKTFEEPFGIDFKDQNRFRTISLEFQIENHIQIDSNQFNSLALLFSQTNVDALIDISIRFNQFTNITFNKESITSNIFNSKHENRHLSIHLIPKTLNSLDFDENENNQINFSSNTFSGLKLSQLNLYIYTLKNDLSLSNKFEYIFNNTNLGQLHFHGSIIRPSTYLLKEKFHSYIRSLTLHRHVDTIDSLTYPYYSTVYSYHIHSIEAYSINLDSFLPLYHNLRSLEIIKPRFEVSINRFIRSLDSLTLDIEYLNENTILSAKHIYNLKLTSRLRRISSQVLNSLSKSLKTFDLSEVDLSEMTSDSRCYLIDFISKYFQSHINIILPQYEYLTECDCAKILLNHIQLNKKSTDHLSCSKQCRFSDCPFLSQFFQNKLNDFNNPKHFISIQNKTIKDNGHDDQEDLPSVDFFSDSIDLDLTHFLINQTNNQPSHSNQRESLRRPIQISEDFNEITNLINQDQSKTIKSKKQKFSWLSAVIGTVVSLVVILVVTILIFFIVKHKKEEHLKSVPVYV